MAVSTFDGWVGNVLLRSGEEYPDDHPLVKERPEMFGLEPKPEKKTKEDEKLEGTKVQTPGPSVAVTPERKKPGPKPGTPRTPRET